MLQCLKSTLFMFIPTGFTDHSRPPLTVSGSATLALSTTENLKCWTVENGARSYNKAMSSEMPSQDPHKVRRNCVLTRRHALLHLLLVAHKDSRPPPPPDRPHPAPKKFFLAQLPRKPAPSPVRSQAGVRLLPQLDSRGRLPLAVGQHLN